MLRHFESALRCFPFSRLQPRALFRVRAVDLGEPPLLERDFSGSIDIDALLEAAKWRRNRDCAFELETAWDLWQFEDDWKLEPARVVIACFAPLFPSEYGEQIRIEFGLDSQFLPQPGIPSSLAPTRHNIQSLLHLVKDLDEALAVEKRNLWSESGENFAERLQQALTG